MLKYHLNKYMKALILTHLQHSLITLPGMLVRVKTDLHTNLYTDNKYQRQA